MTAVLVADQVSKTFGHGKHVVQAVKDVSFSLEENEVVTVVGESGSGKSTLARMVLGLMPITSGHLSFRGHDVSKMNAKARTEYWKEVQAVFQDPFSAFNQFFTVRRLLSRSMRLLDEKVGQERLEESLGYVGLHARDVLDRFPHELSGGQRQRVMIARALMMRPKLLVADEATSMLDASLRVNVLNVLTDLRDQLGMTVLFITHDIGQACYVADRVLVMEHGVMVEQGRADDVIFNPQHEYTQRLLSDVPKLHEQAGSATGADRV
jgi:peptide/nickel transport system ATP-binding protein